MECPICREAVAAIVALPCEHKFCRACLTGWLTSPTGSHDCPMCRKPIPKAAAIDIFYPRPNFVSQLVVHLLLLATIASGSLVMALRWHLIFNDARAYHCPAWWQWPICGFVMLGNIVALVGSIVGSVLWLTLLKDSMHDLITPGKHGQRSEAWLCGWAAILVLAVACGELVI